MQGASGLLLQSARTYGVAPARKDSGPRPRQVVDVVVECMSKPLQTVRGRVSELSTFSGRHNPPNHGAGVKTCSLLGRHCM